MRLKRCRIAEQKPLNTLFNELLLYLATFGGSCCQHYNHQVCFGLVCTVSASSPYQGLLRVLNGFCGFSSSSSETLSPRSASETIRLGLKATANDLNSFSLARVKQTNQIEPADLEDGPTPLNAKQFLHCLLPTKLQMSVLGSPSRACICCLR